MNLTGQVALITGACAPRGIGRAIALRLAKDGAAVAVSDIGGTMRIADADRDRQALLQDLVKIITDAGGKAMALQMDVSNSQDITEGVAHIADQLGPVDILVNNAGSLTGSDAFMNTTPQQWEDSFRINLLGPMRLSQAVIPGMQAKGGGRIINIGSTGSLGAEAGFGAYTTMKHGLVGLSKTIAAEFGVDGIRCNTVCPGYIMTDMHMAANTRLAAENGISIPDMQTRRYAPVALRDAGQPEDVAEAVAYLAGPAGAYVTGINLPVTGGVPYGI